MNMNIPVVLGLGAAAYFLAKGAGGKHFEVLGTIPDYTNEYLDGYVPMITFRHNGTCYVASITADALAAPATPALMQSGADEIARQVRVSGNLLLNHPNAARAELIAGQNILPLTETINVMPLQSCTGVTAFLDRFYETAVNEEIV
jgi:hypothetical protein